MCLDMCLGMCLDTCHNVRVYMCMACQIDVHKAKHVHACMLTCVRPDVRTGMTVCMCIDTCIETLRDVRIDIVRTCV